MYLSSLSSPLATFPAFIAILAIDIDDISEILRFRSWSLQCITIVRFPLRTVPFDCEDPVRLDQSVVYVAAVVVVSVVVAVVVTRSPSSAVGVLLLPRSTEAGLVAVGFCVCDTLAQCA